jgi:hypothetical protein
MAEEHNKTEAELELEQQTDKYGRKTVVTPSVLVKLEQAFALGCTDLEACFYAGIGKSSLYRYEDNNPDFRERKEELKMKPVLLARQTVMKGIAGYELKDDSGKVIKVINPADPKLSLDFLKGKMHREFKSGVEHTGTVKHDKQSTLDFWKRWGIKTDGVDADKSGEQGE